MKDSTRAVNSLKHQIAARKMPFLFSRIHVRTNVLSVLLIEYNQFCVMFLFNLWSIGINQFSQKAFCARFKYLCVCTVHLSDRLIGIICIIILFERFERILFIGNCELFCWKWSPFLVAWNKVIAPKSAVFGYVVLFEYIVVPFTMELDHKQHYLNEFVRLIYVNCFIW